MPAMDVRFEQEQNLDVDLFIGQQNAMHVRTSKFIDFIPFANVEIRWFINLFNYENTATHQNMQTNSIFAFQIILFLLLK